jgi:hypothetical protein
MTRSFLLCFQSNFKSIPFSAIQQTSRQSSSKTGQLGYPFSELLSKISFFKEAKRQQTQIPGCLFYDTLEILIHDISEFVTTIRELEYHYKALLNQTQRNKQVFPNGQNWDFIVKYRTFQSHAYGLEEWLIKSSEASLAVYLINELQDPECIFSYSLTDMKFKPFNDFKAEYILNFFENIVIPSLKHQQTILRRLPTHIVHYQLKTPTAPSLPASPVVTTKKQQQQS